MRVSGSLPIASRMHRWGIWPLLLTLGACTALLPFGGARDPRACVVADSVEYADVEARVHELANRRRAAAGLPALVADSLAAQIARRHSHAMASGELPVGHEDLPRRAQALSRCMPALQVEENVAVMPWNRSLAAATAVQGWMDSPPHRANLLGAHDIAGVGVVRGEDSSFFITQIYVRTRLTHIPESTRRPAASR